MACRVLSLLLLYCLPICLPVPARSCDLALALAVDVSGSVDGAEYALQMQGLADALRDPLIVEGLLRAKAQLTLVQWTGAGRQIVAIPWQDVSSAEALESFASAVTDEPRHWAHFSTAIGEALQFTAALFTQAPACRRRVIDVSGDGLSNEGAEPRDIQPLLKAAGITVNAIAIEASEPDLTGYFYENVIHGEGAFVVTATDFRDYVPQIRRKLIREVVYQSSQLALPTDMARRISYRISPIHP